MSQPLVVTIDEQIIVVTVSGGVGPAGSGGGGGSFLDVSQSESAASYYYYGGLTTAGAWQVNRWTKSSLATGALVANIANNSGVASLSSAWTARASLVYA